MAILSGRSGRVAYDQTIGSPATAAPIASLNSWTLDSKTDF